MTPAENAAAYGAEILHLYVRPLSAEQTEAIHAHGFALATDDAIYEHL